MCVVGLNQMPCFQVEELKQAQKASKDEAVVSKHQNEHLQQQLEACQQALSRTQVIRFT